MKKFALVKGFKNLHITDYKNIVDSKKGLLGMMLYVSDDDHDEMEVQLSLDETRAFKSLKSKLGFFGVAMRNSVIKMIREENETTFKFVRNEK